MRLMEGHAFVLQGGTAVVVKCILVNSCISRDEGDGIR